MAKTSLRLHMPVAFQTPATLTAASGRNMEKRPLNILPDNEKKKLPQVGSLPTSESVCAVFLQLHGLQTSLAVSALFRADAGTSFSIALAKPSPVRENTSGQVPAQKPQPMHPSFTKYFTVFPPLIQNPSISGDCYNLPGNELSACPECILCCPL